jgi:predicted transcriptional regulator
MIIHSIHGPWPTRAEDDYPVSSATLAASESVAMPHSDLTPAVHDVIRVDTALRMSCIQMLREENALTVQEAADLLISEPAAIKSQFLKLRRLGLIEQAGCRKTSAGIQAVYRLNTNNPALEFVLAPTPKGMASPHEVSGLQCVRWE